MSQIFQSKPPISPENHSKQNLVQRHFPWLYALWKFSRPHTVIGTSLSVVGLWAIAYAQSPEPAERIWVPLLAAWLICLCGNVYIVGLNQLQDVDIDRINKPHLPIASGEFSRRTGWIIVAFTGLLALIAAPLQGPFLMLTVWLSLLIGTAYSLPPIRLKRFPFWASVCIFSVRGVIVNVGLFLHAHQQWGGSIHIPASVWALTLFILGFTFAIAIFKDIPDLEGDRQYNISTFTIRLGQAAVFKLARWTIILCYGLIMIASVVLPAVNTLFVIVTHLLALILFWSLSDRVSLSQKSEIAGFYQFIWKLFYVEYIVFPVACLLAM